MNNESSIIGEEKTIQIQKRIEDFILGRLSEKGNSDIVKFLLSNPDWLDYFEIEFLVRNIN